jgi:hypothetical protein
MCPGCVRLPIGRTEAERAFDLLGMLEVMDVALANPGLSTWNGRRQQRLADTCGGGGGGLSRAQHLA